MFKSIIFLIFLAFTINTICCNKINLNKLNINRINKLNTTWKAGWNFPEHVTFDDISHLVKKFQLDSLEIELIKSKSSKNKITFLENSLSVKLPENFDARDKWPECNETIGHIRNQGCCGSCWAVSSSSAISDRICIHSKGKKHFYAAADNIITCQQTKHSHGCDGGQPYEAFDYWVQNGVVSGGDYGSNQGCWPYSFVPTCDKMGPTPPCQDHCTNPKYGHNFSEDLSFGKVRYFLKDEEDMMRDIYENGPIIAEFVVYKDFLHYKKGVYQKTSDEIAGLHDVKVFGWGVEDGAKYWLIANSWGTNFGFNGFFKFLRGQNHCGIESYVASGLPLL